MEEKTEVRGNNPVLTRSSSLALMEVAFKSRHLDSRACLPCLVNGSLPTVTGVLQLLGPQRGDVCKTS